MTEPEVSLRFAIHFIINHLTDEDVTVSIDGAHIRTKNIIHFDITEFMHNAGLVKSDVYSERWQGKYSLPGYSAKINVVSTPGIGDVVVKLKSGRTVLAECKKGKANQSGPEYPLMREAIGQLMTSAAIDDGVQPMVVVPYSEKSFKLATRWSEFSQIKQAHIQFALIREDRDLIII